MLSFLSRACKRLIERRIDNHPKETRNVFRNIRMAGILFRCFTDRSCESQGKINSPDLNVRRIRYTDGRILYSSGIVAGIHLVKTKRETRAPLKSENTHYS